jgi:hypothetical protein
MRGEVGEDKVQGVVQAGRPEYHLVHAGVVQQVYKLLVESGEGGAWLQRHLLTVPGGKVEVAGYEDLGVVDGCGTAE